MSDSTVAPTVFVDSNAIVEQSWLLDSPQWRLLLHQSRHGVIKLVVPEIVILETVARYESKLSDALRALSTAQEGVTKLIECSFPPGPTGSSTEEAANYEQQLRELLDDYNVTIAPFPPIDLVELASRAAWRKRPFNSDGHGFRDAIIWELLISWMADNAQSAPHLISTDNAFYAVKSAGDLHPELIEDALERGVAIPITPWRHPGTYIADAFATDDYQFVSRVAAIIERGHGHLTDWLEASLMALSDDILSVGDVDAEVVEFRNSHLTLKSVAKSDGGPALVSMIFTTDMTIRVGNDVVFDDGSDEKTVPLTVSASSFLDEDSVDFDHLTIDSAAEYVRAQLDGAYQSLRRNSYIAPLLPPLRVPFLDSSIYSRLRDIRFPPLNLGDIATAAAASQVNSSKVNDIVKDLAEASKRSDTAMANFVKGIAEASKVNESALKDLSKTLAQIPRPSESMQKMIKEIFELQEPTVPPIESAEPTDTKHDQQDPKTGDTE